MLKKIVVGTLLAGLIGILVIGAINRTIDRTQKVAGAQGLGSGGNRYAQDSDGRGSAGQGGPWGRATERRYANTDSAPETWETYEGIVVQTPEDGGELVIETLEGEELVVGTGPSYMATQGFNLQSGEAVQLRGYWDGNEFKAAQVTRLQDGQTISLRDAGGRPTWAGAGRSAQGNGQAGGGAQGDASGVGQAQVDGWFEVYGTISSVNTDTLVVHSQDGEQFLLENRPWWFAKEQGFSATVGDEVTLTGFYDGEDFEVSRIDNTTTGETVLIRDENGRPLWAGPGQRGT